MWISIIIEFYCISLYIEKSNRKERKGKEREDDDDDDDDDERRVSQGT